MRGWGFLRIVTAVLLVAAALGGWLLSRSGTAATHAVERGRPATEEQAGYQALEASISKAWAADRDVKGVLTLAAAKGFAPLGDPVTAATKLNQDTGLELRLSAAVEKSTGVVRIWGTYDWTGNTQTKPGANDFIYISFEDAPAGAADSAPWIWTDESNWTSRWAAEDRLLWLSTRAPAGLGWQLEDQPYRWGTYRTDNGSLAIYLRPQTASNVVRLGFVHSWGQATTLSLTTDVRGHPLATYNKPESTWATEVSLQLPAGQR